MINYIKQNIIKSRINLTFKCLDQSNSLKSSNSKEIYLKTNCNMNELDKSDNQKSVKILESMGCVICNKNFGDINKCVKHIKNNLTISKRECKIISP